MALFVGSTEQKMLKELNILSKETSALLGKANKKNIDIRHYVKIFNEMSDTRFHEECKPLLRDVIIKARIFKHQWVQKELRRKLFCQVVPVELSTSQSSLQEASSGSCSQRQGINDDIRITENCLQSWIERAVTCNVDISHFYGIISQVEELRESYSPPERGDFHEEFIDSFYVHHLNLCTNQIIHKVTRDIIGQRAKLLRENPNLKNKLVLITETENWLLKRLPPSETFLPPLNQEETALKLLRLAEEKEEQVYAYKGKIH